MKIQWKAVDEEGMSNHTNVCVDIRVYENVTVTRKTCHVNYSFPWFWTSVSQLNEVSGDVTVKNHVVRTSQLNDHLQGIFALYICMVTHQCKCACNRGHQLDTRFFLSTDMTKIVGRNAIYVYQMYQYTSLAILSGKGELGYSIGKGWAWLFYRERVSLAILSGKGDCAVYTPDVLR